MIKYNIVEVGNEDFILASCPTLELAKKYFKRYGKHVHTYGYWANR